MASGLSTPLSETQAAAGAVCALLHRAYRDYRFYPLDHPMAREAMDKLLQELFGFLEVHGDLLLEVGEDDLSLDGEPVYVHVSDRDNLAQGRYPYTGDL